MLVLMGAAGVKPMQSVGRSCSITLSLIPDGWPVAAAKRLSQSALDLAVSDGLVSTPLLKIDGPPPAIGVVDFRLEQARLCRLFVESMRNCQSQGGANLQGRPGVSVRYT